MAGPDPSPRRGWFATPKAARDAIRAWFDGAEACATALAVFDALCEIANDKGAPSFITDQPWIAAKAGCGVRTVRARLRDLEQVGVVRCVVPKLRGPATFTIAPLNGVPPFGHNDQTFGNNGATFGDNCPTFGKDACRASLPTTEELQKNEEQPLPGFAEAGKGRAVKSKRERKPDPIFDAVAEGFGYFGADRAIAPSNAALVSKTVREIRTVCPDLTAEEVRRRIANLRARFDSPSPAALVKWWTECATPPAPPGPNGQARPQPSEPRIFQ